MSFSPDGTLLAVAANRAPRPGMVVKVKGNVALGEVVLFDIAKASVARTIPDIKHYASAVAFADDGKTLVVAGEGAVTWCDLAAGKESKTWKPFEGVKDPDGGNKIKTFHQCVLSSDGKALAVDAIWQLDGKVGFQGFQKSGEQVPREAVGYDLASSKMTWRASGPPRPQNAVSRLAFSADGTRVAMCLEPNKVQVRDTANGKLVTAPLEIKFNVGTGAIALSAGGGRLVMWHPDGNVALWNLSEASPPLTFQTRGPQTNSVEGQSLSFSPDGKKLLIAMDSTVCQYDAATLRDIRPWEGQPRRHRPARFRRRRQTPFHRRLHARRRGDGCLGHVRLEAGARHRAGDGAVAQPGRGRARPIGLRRQVGPRALCVL